MGVCHPVCLHDYMCVLLCRPIDTKIMSILIFAGVCDAQEASARSRTFPATLNLVAQKIGLIVNP